jgi:hypothetical protein
LDSLPSWSANPQAIDYYRKTVSIAELTDDSPGYIRFKQDAGAAIYPFLQSICQGQASKVTGILKDLAAEEIRKMLLNFDFFLQCVARA